MTDAEWNVSDDVRPMLRHLRDSWQGDEPELDRFLHRYYVASCRRLWILLPLEASRRCVEVAERFLDGKATAEELSAAEYEAEGAAFLFERWAEIGQRIGLPFSDLEPDRVAACINEFKAISPEDLKPLIGNKADPNEFESPRDVLGAVAYLVSMSSCYHGLCPKDAIEDLYSPFLSAALLREMVSEWRANRVTRPLEAQP